MSRSSFSSCTTFEARSGAAVDGPLIDPIVEGTDTPFALGISISEGIMGDANGERPLSDISVLDDSAPGELVVFHPKNDVILFPGVFGGCFRSAELRMFREPESTRIGGGRFDGGCNAMVSERLWRGGGGGLRTGMTGSLERREWNGVPFAKR